MSGLSDIHAALADLQRSTGRIEGTLVSISRSMDERSAQLSYYSKRLRKVENRQHYWSGVSAVIGALIAIVIKRNIA